MKEQRIYYRKYDWDILVFYDVDGGDTYRVVSALMDIGCKGENLSRSVEAVESCRKNSGLTFANLMSREMVVMIGKTTSHAEFLNTLVHELHHMAEFIASEAGVPYTGETISYITGDLAMLMHPVAGKMLCPHCHQKR